MAKQKQTQENQKFEYVSGLSLCGKIFQLEDYIKKINKDPNPALLHDFTRAVSLRKSENRPEISEKEKPFYLSNKQPTAVMDEAIGYMQDNSENVKEFLDKYSNRVIDDYINVLEEEIKNGKGLEGILNELKGAENDKKRQEILKDIKIMLYEAVGNMLSNYEVDEKADKKIKAVAQKIKEMDSLKQEEKKDVIDAREIESVRLRTGTVGLNINYNERYRLIMSGLYRELGENFVKVNEKGEAKLDKEMFKNVYGNQKNLKGVASALYSKLEAVAKEKVAKESKTEQE